MLWKVTIQTGAIGRRHRKPQRCTIVWWRRFIDYVTVNRRVTFWTCVLQTLLLWRSCIVKWKTLLSKEMGRQRISWFVSAIDVSNAARSVLSSGNHQKIAHYIGWRYSHVKHRSGDIYRQPNGRYGVFVNGMSPVVAANSDAMLPSLSHIDLVYKLQTTSAIL